MCSHNATNKGATTRATSTSLQAAVEPGSATWAATMLWSKAHDANPGYTFAGCAAALVSNQGIDNFACLHIDKHAAALYSIYASFAHAAHANCNQTYIYTDSTRAAAITNFTPSP